MYQFGLQSFDAKGLIMPFHESVLSLHNYVLRSGGGCDVKYWNCLLFVCILGQD